MKNKNQSRRHLRVVISVSLYLFIGNICIGQLNPAKIFLRSGDSIVGVKGKFLINTFKYKTHDRAKAIKIDKSEIDHVQIRYPSGNVGEIYVFQTINSNNFISIEREVKGKYVDLYTNSFPYGMQTVYEYYVKKQGDSRLTDLGRYSPLINDLRGKVIDYFSDCPELVEKIKNGDFKVRDGLKKIVEFYNENCHSE